jgi:hypothetical protein
MTADELKRVLTYEADTGLFRWLVPTNRQVVNGAVAGRKTTTGYWNICINKKRYMAHRLAWLYVYGRWPADQIDHINRNRIDNRIANLREATNSQNNSWKPPKWRLPAGVCVKRTPSGKWEAHMTVSRQYRFLGTFSTREAAIEARRLAIEKEYGWVPPLRG